MALRQGHRLPDAGRKKLLQSRRNHDSSLRRWTKLTKACDETPLVLEFTSELMRRPFVMLLSGYGHGGTSASSQAM